MIYQLNNETHWEISPRCMRTVIKMIDTRLGGDDMTFTEDGVLIELSNLRAAFENELFRLRDKDIAKRIDDGAKPVEIDNMDLLG